jgi:itaconate CoA-transferase
MHTKPLAGLEVVSLEQAVAAPFCTARLADAGARVIKIERPEGDFARYYDNATEAGSSYFVWLNRGKESVVLDLARVEARHTLERLITRADILVQNLKPGALARLGFEIARLRTAYPALICCSISGYGESGPLADRKAYDLLIQAESGLCSITGGPDGPARVGISVVDIATGATAHAAILEALIARGRHGGGADIRLSMFDVMADWLTVPLLNSENGNTPIRNGLSHASIAPYGVFTASDGRQILISVQSEREWKSFCRYVLSDYYISTDPRLASNVDRVANRKYTDQIVDNILARLPMEMIIARLTKADIAFARFNDMSDLSSHAHLRRSNADTAFGPVRLPAHPVIVDGVPVALGRIPALGESTQSVLADLTN